MRGEKFVPWVRYVNGIEIYQKTPHDIQIRQGKNTILVTNWKQPRGEEFAGGWGTIRRRLSSNRSLTSISQIINMANEVNVLVLGVRYPEEPPDEVERIK